MGKLRKHHKNRKLPKNYYNYFDVCIMEGIEPSRAKNAVGKSGVEGIKSLPELEPIEDLFEVFEKPVKNRIVNSYGILRRYYDDWKRDGTIRKFSTGRPPKKGTTILKATVPIKLKEEFQSLVDAANDMSAVQVTYSDMICIAVREFIDRRPQFQNKDDD